MSYQIESVKITGARGDWTAAVEGFSTRLAVIHNVWWTPPDRYFDPMDGAKLDGKRRASFIDALHESDCVVMQRTRKIGEFARIGYIGIFRFTNLEISETGAVSLKIVERLPLKPA